jgi:cob(I)alamin adenosyltransferase
MAKEKLPALTDDQIRAFVTEVQKQLFNYAAELGTLQKALLNKGVLSEADLAKAKKQLSAEMKEQIQRISSATRQKPPGGIQ